MLASRILTFTMAFSMLSSLASGQVSTLSLLPSDSVIEPHEMGNPIFVEVFLDQASQLLGWQVSLEVTGGDAGSLDLVNLFVTETRSDYVFGGAGFSSISAVSLPAAEMFAILTSPSWVDVTGPAYLGTFELQASSDALGVFNIRLVADTNTTFLVIGNGTHLVPTLDNSSVISVVQCIVDTDCDDGLVCTDDTCNSGTCVNTNDDTNACADGNACTDDACSSGVCVSINDDANSCTDSNDCTSDACVSGVCTSTNELAGTTCDDGLFCTSTDECDGSGTCVSSGSPCGGRAPFCCETLSTCTVLPCI